MRVLSAQFNYHIIDFENNTKKVLTLLQEQGNEVDLIVFSPLCLSGYYPFDLILEPNFIEIQNQHLALIQQQTKHYKAAVVLSYIEKNNGPGKPFYHSLGVFERGNRLISYHQKKFSSENFWGENRLFEPGKLPGTFIFQNKIIGILL